MKIQEETDVKEYQIRKKKSREQTVENIENKENIGVQGVQTR